MKIKICIKGLNHFFTILQLKAVILNCNNISQYLTYLTFLFTIPYTMPESYQVFSISLTW